MRIAADLPDAPRIDCVEDLQALLEASATHVVVKGVVIEGGFSWPAENIEATFVECRFEDCILSGAELEGVQFRGCEFPQTSLRGANLRDAQFIDCKLYTDDQPADFRYAELRDVSFEGCDLTTARFERANAYGLKLNRCQAQGADFTSVDFGMAMSRNHTVIDFECKGSNLAYADFSGTYLPGASFRDTRLVHAVFQQCDLSNATLVDCELDNIEAQHLSLAGADLRGSRFNNVDPRRIDLTDAKIDADQALTLLQAMGIEVH